MVKKFFGLVSVLAVCALLLASCGGGGGSVPASGGSGILSKATPPRNEVPIAVFKSASVTDSDGTNTEWFYFFTDGTFEDCLKGTHKGVTVNCVVAKGSYSGDPRGDNMVRLTITHIAETEDGELIQQEPAATEMFAISGGKVIGGGEGLGIELVRQ